jgi:hypothetical protein
MVPMAFHVKDFYCDLVADTLARLPAEVVADEPVYCAMADRAAALVDDSSYSIDFRIEAYDSLKLCLSALEAAEAAHLSVVK